VDAPVSPYEWFAVVQAIALGVAGVFVWLLGRERAATHEQLSNLRQDLDDGMTSIWRALNKLPDMEQLRRVFESKDRINDLLRESHGQRSAIWDEIKRIRDRQPPRRDYGEQ